MGALLATAWPSSTSLVVMMAAYAGANLRLGWHRRVRTWVRWVAKRVGVFWSFLFVKLTPRISDSGRESLCGVGPGLLGESAKLGSLVGKDCVLLAGARDAGNKTWNPQKPSILWFPLRESRQTGFAGWKKGGVFGASFFELTPSVQSLDLSRFVGLGHF